MANFKKILINVFLMIIILIIGYFLLEKVSARLIKDFKVDKKIEYMESKLNKNHMLNIGQPDEALGWGYRPGAHDCIKTSEYDVCYSINSKGLRDTGNVL